MRFAEANTPVSAEGWPAVSWSFRAVVPMAVAV